MTLQFYSHLSVISIASPTSISSKAHHRISIISFAFLISYFCRPKHVYPQINNLAELVLVAWEVFSLFPFFSLSLSCTSQTLPSCGFARHVSSRAKAPLGQREKMKPREVFHASLFQRRRRAIIQVIRISLATWTSALLLI